MSNRPNPRLTIRLTPEEWAEIQTKAGAKPLATFARELLLKEASRRRKAPVRAVTVDQAAYTRLLEMLGSSAIVQAFRDAVTGTADGTLPTSVTIEEKLEDIAADISQMKRLLMHALGDPERVH